MGRTPEREAEFDFTFPYMTMHGAIVVREDNSEIEGVEDLQGKRVAVLKDDNAHEYLQRANTGASIVPLDSFATAMRELSAGRHDAVVIQKLLAYQIMREAKLENLRTVGPPLTEFRQAFCFAVREGDSDLLSLLNEGLSIVMVDGTFRKLYSKWFTPLEETGRTRSRIVIGGDSNYPPYEFIDANGQPAGFNVDLSRAIAKQKGLSINIRLAPWEKIRSGLADGRIDLTHGMFFSLDRDEQFDFTQPHTLIQHVIVTRKGSAPLSDMKSLADKSILVMTGDVMHDLALKHGYGASVIPVETQEEVLRRLSMGEGDCALVARVPAQYWIERHGWSNLTVTGEPVLSAEYCYAALPGQSALLSDFAEGLAALKDTEEYRAIQTKWLSPYEEMKPVPVLKYVLYVAVPLLILLAGALIWTRMLQAQVRKRTAELHRHQEWLQVTLGSIGDAVLAADTEAKITFLNPVAQALTGWSFEEAEGRAASEVFRIINEETGQPAEDVVLRVLRDGQTIALANHTALVTRDGRHVPIEDSAAPIRDSENRIIGAVLVFHDMEDKRRAQEALKQSADQVEQLARQRQLALDAAHLGWWQYDPVSRVSRWDEGYKRIFGLSGHSKPNDEILREIIHPEDLPTLWSKVEAAFDPADPQPYDAQYRIRRADDGQERWIEAHGLATFEGEGDGCRAVSFVGTVEDITAHKAHEQALHRLAQFPEENPNPVLRIGTDCVLQYANAPARDWLAGIGWQDGVSLPASINELVELCQQEHRPVQRELSSTNGSTLWLSAVQPDDEPYINLYGRDITERREVEEALRRSEARFRQVVESLPPLVWTCRADGPCDYLSPQWIEYTGKPEEEQLGYGWLDQLHPDDRQRTVDEWQATAAKGRDFVIQFRIRRHDGVYRWFHTSAVALRDDDGNILKWFGSNTDVDDYRRAEEALRESERQSRFLADIITSASQAVGVGYPDGRLKMVNKAFEELTGYTTEELQAVDWTHVLTPAKWRQIEREKLEELNRTGMPVRYEKEYIRKDGSIVPIELLVNVVKDSQGQVQYYHSFITDISERKLAEHALRTLNETLEHRVAERTREVEFQSDRLRALASELTMAEQRERRRLAQLLHDGLQQILVASRMRLSALTHSSAEDVRQRAAEISDLLSESIEMSRSLTADLFPPILHEGGLAPALEWLARRMLDKQGMEVDLNIHGHVEPSHEEINILLFQAVRELLFNAVKHSGTKSARVDMVRCDHSVQVQVSDEGCGFDPSDLTIERAEGGFGLFSIRERLKWLGGQMEIDSTPGRGSRFALRIPLPQTAGEPLISAQKGRNIAVAYPAQPVACETGSQAIRVMLVDDHLIMRQGLCMLIREVPDMELAAEASNAEVAIKLAREVRPDVILMDIGLPGMNGIEATKLILAEQPQIQIIGLSMFEEAELSQSMIHAGATAYLTKSGPSENLIAAIRAAAMRRRPD